MKDKVVHVVLSFLILLCVPRVVQAACSSTYGGYIDGDSIICNGSFPCYGGTPDTTATITNCKTIHCSGIAGCRKANINAARGATVTCATFDTCSGATVTVDEGLVNCLGFGKCNHVSIFNDVPNSTKVRCLQGGCSKSVYMGTPTAPLGEVLCSGFLSGGASSCGGFGTAAIYASCLDCLDEGCGSECNYNGGTGNCQEAPTCLSQTPSMVPSDSASEVPSFSHSTAPSDVASEVPSVSHSTAPSDVASAVPSASLGEAAVLDVPSSIPSSQPSTSHPLSSVPSARPTIAPSNVPSAPPSKRPSAPPSGSPSALPSHQPSGKPSVTPTGSPTGHPSVAPSDKPSVKPSMRPSARPSLEPSSVPSVEASVSPSGMPSVAPTDSPSARPSLQPSSVPSVEPSESPTGTPSAVPSVDPSSIPSSDPSTRPSAEPSDLHSSMPSGLPSGRPSYTPSVVHSGQPSSPPSAVPSVMPSSIPSGSPSSIPSAQPSSSPSVSQRPSSSIQPSFVPSFSQAPSVSIQPSTLPSSTPSTVPSTSPSNDPTTAPSLSPSSAPTVPTLDVFLVDNIENGDGTTAVFLGVSRMGGTSTALDVTVTLEEGTTGGRGRRLQTTFGCVGLPSNTIAQLMPYEVIAVVSFTLCSSIEPISVVTRTNADGYAELIVPLSNFLVPSSSPSAYPSSVASAAPSNLASSRPSSEPSNALSNMPSSQPSSQPSSSPSSPPSLAPSADLCQPLPGNMCHLAGLVLMRTKLAGLICITQCIVPARINEFQVSGWECGPCP